MNKKQKLQFLIDQQQLAINELRSSMEDFKADADMDEDDTKDPEDFSQQTVAKEAEMRLRQQLLRAENDLALLERFATESFNTVQAGALIETETYWFLAGISLGGYESKKTDIHCVSVGSPAYEAILGKKVGDSFTLGNNQYLIKDIV